MISARLEEIFGEIWVIKPSVMYMSEGNILPSLTMFALSNKIDFIRYGKIV